jgi:SAM-dependent methyltransferase
MNTQFPRLYDEFADWFHLLTAPEDYASEADFYLQKFESARGNKPTTLLELGSGGGNMASHYKRSVDAILVDLSSSMLATSKRINPECAHVQGDMRTVRLGRAFDAVLVHDAVCYLCTIGDLQKAFVTAFVHCKPGGAAIFAPDHVRDSFMPITQHGGHDGEHRSLRYLEWTTDPDPSDTTYRTEYAYLMHERGQATRIELDTHTCGLFSEAQWRRGLEEAGFTPVTQMQGPEEESRAYTIFLAVKPSNVPA